MNYATLNSKNDWEVLRLYDFKGFADGVYSRDAILEIDPNVKYQLNDIPLPNGVLRIDRVTVPTPTTVRLGHYTLPKLEGKALSQQTAKSCPTATIISNGNHSLAMLPLYGWDKTTVSYPTGLHPVSDTCGLIQCEKQVSDQQVFVTLMLWKKGSKSFSKKELSPVKDVKVAADKSSVTVTMADGTSKTIKF